VHVCVGHRTLRPNIFTLALCDHEAFCYFEQEVSRACFLQVRLVKKNAIVVLISQGKETWDSLDLNLDLLNFGAFFFQ
jgi:hypothetical protein